MKKLIPLLALAFTAPSMAEAIYKWVDEYGQTHFSDVPRNGAEEVDLAPAQTFSAPAVTSSSGSAAEEPKEDAPAYESVRIVSPGMEETIWNTGGKVTVAVSLQPGLLTGHRIRLSMDGKPLQEMPPRMSSMQLSDVERGEHELVAEIRDENGRVLKTSDPVKFFYQQTSVNRRPGAF